MFLPMEMSGILTSLGAIKEIWSEAEGTKPAK